MKTITKIVYNKEDAQKAVEHLSKCYAGTPLPIVRTVKKFWGYSNKEVMKNEIPLMCEYSLYALLGKDDARSVLGSLRILAEYLGVKSDF